MKIMMFGFDGLRPDCVTQDVMPNLYSFLEKNCECSNARSVFPSETYVNHPTIFSGFLPEQHGLIANAFYDTSVSRKDFFLGSIVERIEEAERMTQGNLFEVPTLSETLAANGRSYISVSSNSPGSTRLMAHKSETLGQINISVNGFAYAVPSVLKEKYGSDKEGNNYERPEVEGLKKMNEVVHDLFETYSMADVNVIWYGEPDHSFHQFGIGSPEAKKALEAADGCFGQLLDRYWKDDVQVIVLSDHGHVTIEKQFNLTEELEKRGFVHTENLLDTTAGGFSLLWGYSGNIYVHNKALIKDMVYEMQNMDEMGMIFTQDYDGINGALEGTFSKRLVSGDHPRSGDIRYVLRSEDKIDKWGKKGTCVCHPFLDNGCSIHGGLNENEVHTLLGFGGSAFKKEHTVNTVTGVLDVTPTIYHLLGITPTLPTQGTVISEVLKEKRSISEPVILEHTYTTRKGPYIQKLSISYKNRIPYIISGQRV